MQAASSYAHPNHYYTYTPQDQIRALAQKDQCWLCLERLSPSDDFLDRVLNLFFKKAPFPTVYGHPHSLKNRYANNQEVLVDGIHERCLRSVFQQNNQQYQCGSCNLPIVHWNKEEVVQDRELLARNEWKKTLSLKASAIGLGVSKMAIVFGSAALAVQASSQSIKSKMVSDQFDLSGIERELLIGAGLGTAIGMGALISRRLKGSLVIDAVTRTTTVFAATALGLDAIFTITKTTNLLDIEKYTLMDVALVPPGLLGLALSGTTAGFGAFRAGLQTITGKGFIGFELAQLYVCGLIGKETIRGLLTTSGIEPEEIEIAELIMTVGIAIKASLTASRSLQMMQLWRNVDPNMLRYFGTMVAVASLVGVIGMTGDLTSTVAIVGAFGIAVVGNMLYEEFHQKHEEVLYRGS